MKQLSKSLKTISDPDDRYRYILHSRIEEKQVFKLFVRIEKQKTVPLTKVSELAGQRLLWEYCQAYNKLPQVPIASLTGMMVILKVSLETITAVFENLNKAKFLYLL